MTMFIKIAGCNVSRIGNTSPFIVIADMNGRQLKRTAPRSDGFAAWDSEAFICNDTLQSILLYVYSGYNSIPENLLGVGKFDFNQVRGLPYEKINVDVQISNQNITTGSITLQAQYNQGQIFIGQSSHMQLGSAVYRAPVAPPSLMVAGTNTSSIIQPPTIITPPVVPVVEQQVIASVGGIQDGLIPIQMVQFHPTHNLFSMWDVHYPDSKFKMVQPHLRKVVYRN